MWITLCNITNHFPHVSVCLFFYFFLPVMDKDSISVDLVLQREVEGEVFCAFVVVNLHSGGVLIGLEVLDDIWEPHREPIEPGNRNKSMIQMVT